MLKVRAPSITAASAAIVNTRKDGKRTPLRRTTLDPFRRNLTGHASALEPARYITRLPGRRRCCRHGCWRRFDSARWKVARVSGCATMRRVATARHRRFDCEGGIVIDQSRSASIRRQCRTSLSHHGLTTPRQALELLLEDIPPEM